MRPPRWPRIPRQSCLPVPSFLPPRAPMMATNPGFSDTTLVAAQGASNIYTSNITCDGIAPVGGSRPT
ncbi:hypothetical protein PUN4_230174 [Paraburkholderia unamae]|nr:hypothetical protein PUN4_230174 [Paraburkholderia unamae]